MEGLAGAGQDARPLPGAALLATRPAVRRQVLPTTAIARVEAAAPITGVAAVLHAAANRQQPTEALGQPPVAARQVTANQGAAAPGATLEQAAVTGHHQRAAATAPAATTAPLPLGPVLLRGAPLRPLPVPTGALERQPTPV